MAIAGYDTFTNESAKISKGAARAIGKRRRGGEGHIYIEMKLVGVGGRRNRQTHLAKAETQDDGKAKVAAHQSLPGAHQGQHTGTQEY